MSADVFLSYARGVSLEPARAAQRALAARGISTFLDEQDIDFDAHFPERIVDALLDSRVVVVFVHDAYVARRYCAWEAKVALWPFELVDTRPGTTAADRARALDGIVVALPPDGAPRALQRLPPALQTTHAARADRPDDLVDVIAARLRDAPPTLAARLDALAETGGAGAARARLLGEVLVPPPRSLRGHVRAPKRFPPSLGERFVGREDDLWRLDRELAPHAPEGSGEAPPAERTVVLHGMGGIGKTQLACEYVWRFGPQRFPGGLFWIDAGLSEALVDERLEEVLVALDPAAAERSPRSKEAVRADVARAFDSLAPDRPALVVVDNIPIPAPGARPQPLASWCPMAGLTTVLAISQLDLRSTVEGAVGGSLDVLTGEQAVSLLTDGFPGRGQLAEPEWERIGEWVGRLPLALTLLRAILIHAARSAAELLADATARRPITPELDAGMRALASSVPPGALRGMTEAYQTSFELLTPAARRGACLIALLSPSPIPLALVELLAEQLTAEVRVMLVSRSFVSTTPSTEPPLFRAMHGVLADYLRTRASAEDAGVVRRAIDAFCARLGDDLDRATKELVERAEAFRAGSEPSVRAALEEVMQASSNERWPRNAVLDAALSATQVAGQLARNLRALGRDEPSEAVGDTRDLLSISIQSYLWRLQELMQVLAAITKPAMDAPMVPVRNPR